ncbi:hypothetical protein TcasGA2_TC001987 [Tribolium castaneum]|uniref:Uncharacterized protein n=1 Tax=Tribolium castaneum TaxID=7070 RepID=D7EJX8_TRICA|nr:hypothetical protein TcasGA2_TC001987 [Tribolium castaneum]
MEHARKMIMIDPSELERLHNRKDTQPNTLNELDHEMKRIIDMKNIDDNEKWTLYNQVLQKYLKISSRSREPVSLPIIYPKKEDDQIKQSERISLNILGSLPTTLQVKANILLNIITHNGVPWNETVNPKRLKYINEQSSERKELKEKVKVKQSSLSKFITENEEEEEEGESNNEEIIANIIKKTKTLESSMVAVQKQLDENE